MSESVMVIVHDPDDPRHGEINVVESLHKGARLVETLLEAGFDQTRIRVFTGAEMDMRVRHKPVVNLVTGDESTEAAAEADEEEVKEPAAPAAKAESRKEEIEVAPYERNGVRFSTAFRPA